MKILKILSALLALVLCVPESWAQKKTLIKSVTKAVLEKPAVSSTQLERPYAQLLAQTKAHIQKTGYRPRACITDERGLRIPASKMTEEQLQEFRLGGVVARTIHEFKTGDLAPHDADLKELQILVEAHPNPRSYARTIPYLDKHQQEQKEDHIKNVYAQTIEYIATHHRRPRSAFYDAGVILSQREVKEKYPALYEEIHLGAQISSLVQWNRKNAPNHPLMNKLQQLLLEYSRARANKDNPTEILNDLRSFLSTYKRLPRKVIKRNKKRLLVNEMTEEEYQEITLARQLNNLLAVSPDQLPEKDRMALEEINLLIAQHRSQVVSRLLEQLRTFVNTYNRLPRYMIFHNKKRLKQAELSPQEQAEVLLSSRLNEILYPSKPINFSQGDKAALEEIKNLLNEYRPPMPSDAELLSQANAWVAAHHGFRPRSKFFKDAQLVPVRELSPEQYEEVLLARRIPYVVNHATEITPEIEGLQRILKLPMRPQSPDGISPQDEPIQEITENPYDDFEEYF